MAFYFINVFFTKQKVKPAARSIQHLFRLIVHSIQVNNTAAELGVAMEITNIINFKLCTLASFRTN